MNGVVKKALVLLCLAVSVVSSPARADVLPPKVGCSTKGAACDNAWPAGLGAGVCTTGIEVQEGGPTCAPADSAGAGHSACLFCQAASGAAGDAGVSASGGASNSAGASGAGSTKSSTSGDSGCSVLFHRLGTERAVATFMLGLGLLALVISRRRR